MALVNVSSQVCGTHRHARSGHRDVLHSQVVLRSRVPIDHAWIKCPVTNGVLQAMRIRCWPTCIIISRTFYQQWKIQALTALGTRVHPPLALEALFEVSVMFAN
jgi:hypothetical protein